MIPKVIHYCWFGNAKKTRFAKKCIKSWQKNCPDYEIKEWNESNFDLDCCTYVRQAYQAKKWAFVADYFRFWVLANHGGIYLDADVRVFRNFDDFLRYDFFCGYEEGENLEPAIIGGSKGNEVAVGFLQTYASKSFLINGQPDVTPLPVNFTEYYKNSFSFVLSPEETKEENNRLVVEKNVFRPDKTSHGSPILTPKTVAMHCYAGSWIGAKSKMHVRLHRIAVKIFGVKAVNSMGSKRKK